MRILFCDDDQVIASQLRAYVSEFFDGIGGNIPEFAVYHSGDQLLANDSLVADIAFLDVEMPGVNGIHVGAKLQKKNPSIKVFIVTSYPDYLDEAMRFHVFRYLSKPIDKNRLYRNLKDALYQYNMETHEYAIATASGVITRKSDEIISVETSQRKVLVTTTKETLLSSNSMEFWREKLTLPCFYSPHRSFIINMKFVDTIQKDKILLKYKDTRKEAYLARRKYTHFKNTYLIYVESVK